MQRGRINGPLKSIKYIILQFYQPSAKLWNVFLKNPVVLNWIFFVISLSRTYLPYFQSFLWVHSLFGGFELNFFFIPNLFVFLFAMFTSFSTISLWFAEFLTSFFQNDLEFSLVTEMSEVLQAAFDGMTESDSSVMLNNMKSNDSPLLCKL